MKVFVALLAVVALAAANPLPLVQIIVNVDAPATGEVAEDIVTPVERPVPEQWPVAPVELPPPMIPDPIILPDPVILPQPIIPNPEPEAVALPDPVLPEHIPEPVVMPDELIVAAALPTH